MDKDKDSALIYQTRTVSQEEEKKRGKRNRGFEQQEARSIGRFLNLWILGGKRLAADDTQLAANESHSEEKDG